MLMWQHSVETWTVLCVTAPTSSDCRCDVYAVTDMRLTCKTVQVTKCMFERGFRLNLNLLNSMLSGVTDCWGLADPSCDHTDLFQRHNVEGETSSFEYSLQLSHRPLSLLHRLTYSTPLWEQRHTISVKGFGQNHFKWQNSSRNDYTALKSDTLNLIYHQCRQCPVRISTSCEHSDSNPGRTKRFQVIFVGYSLQSW